MQSPATRQRLLTLATALCSLALVATPQLALSQYAGPYAELGLTASEIAWLSKHPVVRIGAEINYAPYEFQNSAGKFTGVIADYLEIITGKLGKRFQIIQLQDFAALENKLRTKDLDAVLALARSAQREEFLTFTRPYLHSVNVIVTRDDFGFVSGLREFDENRVAVVGGSAKHLTSRVYPNWNARTYPDLLDGLMAVSTGQVDGLVDDIFPIVYTIRHRQISNLKIATAVEKALQPQGFSIAVRKDWPELTSILDKLLATITHEEQREISQKWLSVRYEDKIDYRAIWTSIAIFSAILLAAVLWIRQLSQQRKALLAARAEAEAANRAKDQFLANMSHELRTPLHAILGYADLMREGGLSDSSHREAVSTIAGSGRHLLTLINDLLDLSRIRSGHLDLSPAPVHLPALFDEIAAMVRIEAQRKGLQFFLDEPPDLPEVVHADGRRLRQILLNLLGNAIKFTDAGGVTLTVKSDPVEPGNIRLHVSVKDTGIGIATKDKAKIFTPFEQAGEGQKRESGTGLGLAISRELARLMNGEVELDTDHKGGSHFHFSVTLPIVEEPLPVTHVHDQIFGYVGKRRRILVADDQEENRRLLQQILEPLGFDVVLAGDGRSAIDKALATQPDLIVMDLRMPGANGVEAARTIRQSAGLESVSLVAASASIPDLERAAADPDAFAICLRKPYQKSDLLDAIERILGLTWQYADLEMSTVTDQEQSTVEVVQPPRSVLMELLDLARLGKLIRVEHLAMELENRDAKYRPFARRLYALAHGFEEERLIEWLEQSLGAIRDAVAE